MKNSACWGFIGCGNLSQAIISGAIQKKISKPNRICATNRTQEKLNSFSRKSKIKKTSDNRWLVQNSDVIVLGTKPQDLLTVLQEISPYVAGKTIVSLAAGVPSDILKKYLSKAKVIIRVMANTPAMVNEGSFGIFIAKGKATEARVVVKLFEAIGTVAPLKSDEQVDVFTSASASGTGFVFLFMEQFEKFLVRKGFTKELARQVTLKTFYGTVVLGEKSDSTFEKLRERITSKKGTTLAGLNKMRAKGVPSGLQSGLEAAYLRSKSLAKSLRQSSK